MFAKIKEILKGEKMGFIIVEDGEPSFVVLPVEKYRKLKIDASRAREEEVEADVKENNWMNEFSGERFDNNETDFEIPEEFLTDNSEELPVSENVDETMDAYNWEPREKEENNFSKEEVKIENLPF